MKYLIFLMFLFFGINAHAQNNLKHNFVPHEDDYAITIFGERIDNLTKAYYHYKLDTLTNTLNKFISALKYEDDLGRINKIYHGELYYAVLLGDTFYCDNSFLVYDDLVLRSNKLKNFNIIDSILDIQKIYSDNNDILHASYNVANDGENLFLRINTDKVLKFNLNMYDADDTRFYQSFVKLYHNTVIIIDISYLKEGYYKLNVSNFVYNKWINFKIDRSERNKIKK